MQTTHPVPLTSLPRVLVVGGAGYIGSHMVKHLLRQGCYVVTYGNSPTGSSDVEHCNPAIPAPQQPGHKTIAYESSPFERRQ